MPRARALRRGRSRNDDVRRAGRSAEERSDPSEHGITRWAGSLWRLPLELHRSSCVVGTYSAHTERRDQRRDQSGRASVTSPRPVGRALVGRVQPTTSSSSTKHDGSLLNGGGNCWLLYLAPAGTGSGAHAIIVQTMPRSVHEHVLQPSKTLSPTARTLPSRSHPGAGGGGTGGRGRGTGAGGGGTGHAIIVHMMPSFVHTHRLHESSAGIGASIGKTSTGGMA